MLTAVLVAAVVGGGVLVLLRRLFPQQKALPPLRLPGDTMRGKTVIITGANSGIGKALARELLALQARVIMACRDRDRAEEAAREIRAQTGARGELEVRILDLASLQSVRRFCEQINQEEPRLDVLVNNAGVYQCPYTRTEDGFETQFGVNHLGHFLLTHLLLDLLRRSSPSRVVVVSSKLYKYGFVNFQDLNSETSYDKAFCYSQSKLANLLFTLELATRLRRSEEEQEEESRRSTGAGGGAAVQEEVQRVTVNALTPGIVRTNLGRHVPIPLLAKPLFKMASMAFFKTPLQGAQTPLYLATSPEVDGVSGKCFANCKEEELTAAATDREAARRLWEVSCKMVGIEE